MSLSVTEIVQLQEYLDGVMTRADHHAQNVNEVVLALVGAVIWRKDLDPISVRTWKGATANALKVQIGGNVYAFLYSHEAGGIEMRERNHRGRVLHIFSNATPASQVKQIFESL